MNVMQGTQSLHEYVFLSLLNATETKTGYYTWTLPAQYYSTDRGSVCYVSLADGNVFVDDDTNITARWEGGAQNFICSNNDTGAFLKTFTYIDKNSAVTTHRITSSDPIKLLVSARPRQIHLSFYDSDCQPISLTSGVIALKFEYLDPQSAVEGLQSTMYEQM